MNIEDMNEEQFEEHLKTNVPRKDWKSMRELRKSNIKAKGIESPKTKMVENDDGTITEVQTVSDTKDPNKVPSTLNGYIPSNTDKEEGEVTTQTSNAEQVMNDINKGEEGSKVGKEQIKEVWGGETETSKEEPTDIKEVKETVEEEIPLVDKDDTKKETQEKIRKVHNYLRHGIIRDYKNGLFGEVGSADAKALAGYFVTNRIGSFLANMSNGYFGRPMVKSAYGQLLDEQEKALTQIGVDLAEIQKYGQALREDEDFVKGATAKGLATSLNVNEPAVVARYLDDAFLSSFSEKVKGMDDANLANAHLKNNQVRAEIANALATAKKIGADTRKVEEEIQNLIIENRYKGTKEVAGIINTWADSISKGFDIGAKVAKAITSNGI